MLSRAYITVILLNVLLVPRIGLAEVEAPREPGSEGPGVSSGGGGREWIEVGHGIRFGVGARSIGVGRGVPSIVYVGTDVGYIYRSIDGGATWDETRLLPDDRPLLNVPLMNPWAIPFPNNGLVDPTSIHVPQGTYGWPSTGHTNWSFGSEAVNPRTGLIGVAGMTTGRLRVDEGRRANAFALVGSGARTETEDPGNLMASFFSGVSAQPGQVNWISTCPSDPTVTFAATNFGAFRTTDMGITWDRVFIGSSTEENYVRSIMCHPENSRSVVLATAQGLRISRNGGEEWDRPTGNLGSWGANFVTTHPLDRRRLLVGTGLGAYETVTGAEEETLYLADTPSPDVRIVNAIRATTNEDIIYVGTNDGASYSHDGGRTWTRVAEFLLGHYRVRMVQVDPDDPMHAYFLTDYHLFETHDGGRSLEMILWGYTGLKYLLIDPNDSDVLWLVGYSQVWRYERPRVRTGPLSENARRARAALSRDPGHYAVMDRALELARLDPPTVQETQRRMRRASLVPTINIFAWVNFNDASHVVDGTERISRYARWISARCWSHQSVNYCDFSRSIFQQIRAELFEPIYAGFIMFTWPFARAAMDERQTGRMWRDVFSMQNRMMYNVYDYWADRRRLLEYLAEGTATPTEEAAYMLRIEEMTAVLDGLTDGMLGGPFGDEARRSF